jgi:predicted nucleic acid-binding protein
MTIRVELNPETEARLKAEARARPTSKVFRGKASSITRQPCCSRGVAQTFGGVSGVQVHDARLVAAMRVHGVKSILTFNDRDFTRYTDIDAVHPRSVSLA